MKLPTHKRMLGVTLLLCLMATLGCGSGSRSSDNRVQTPPKSTDSSTQDAPGPQTEPDLSAEPKLSEETESVTVRVADKPEFEALVAQHKGQVILIDYWATWCAPCLKKLPQTLELARSLKSDGLALITVAMDDEDAHGDVEDFLKEHNATFDNLRAKGGTSDESFATFDIPDGALPCLRLFDREGQLVKTFAVDPTADKQFTHEDVAAAVKEQLAK